MKTIFEVVQLDDGTLVINRRIGCYEYSGVSAVDMFEKAAKAGGVEVRVSARETIDPETNLVCPYCGDAMDVDNCDKLTEDDGQDICYKCGNEFVYNRDTVVTYRAQKLEGDK